MMLIVMLIAIGTVIVWLYQTSASHFQTFVHKTQVHIKNINSKLQEFDRSEEKKELDVESTYLELLGFVDKPKLFNEDQFKNTSIVFLTAFTHFSDRERALIESKIKYFPDQVIIIYDIDLSFSEHLKIQKLCNKSCALKTFKAEKFPKHIFQAKLKLYKPIIIQEILNEHGFLLWIEPPNVFVSSSLEEYLSKSLQDGITAWTTVEPVTQMTHPLMFKYFTLNQKDYFFVHMIDTSKIILFNKLNIHQNLMLPWVKCALKEDCISPLGSQFSGCDFNRRPEFLYSGCHRYESSSFSIITSMLFDFDLSKYTIDSNESIISLYSQTQAPSMLGQEQTTGDEMRPVSQDRRAIRKRN